MRKNILFVLIAASLFVIGCKKETTYQVFNNTTKPSSSADPYLDGSMWEVVIFEYAGNDVITQKNIDRVEVGKKSQIFTAHEKAEKIKVSFKFLPPQSNYKAILLF